MQKVLGKRNFIVVYWSQETGGEKLLWNYFPTLHSHGLGIIQQPQNRAVSVDFNVLYSLLINAYCKAFASPNQTIDVHFWMSLSFIYPH